MRLVVKNRISNQRGQSALEFMLCTLVIFFFLFFYLSLAILLVTSNYIDYATFMAARTYKSAYNNNSTKLQNAQRVFRAYTNKVEGVAANINLQLLDQIPGSGDPQTAGFIATYNMPLFYMPPMFLNERVPNRINLTAEAHLGSDPGLEDCSRFFGDFARKHNLNLDGNLLEEMDDNGC